MALRPIRIYGDPVLRKTATPIGPIDQDVLALIDDMIETMYDAPGVGLAAPQVGCSVRLFVLDPTMGEEPGKAFALINPELDGFSKETDVLEEGCLSFPDIRADINRPLSCTVRYTTADGDRVEGVADDLFARAIQHEYDHLDGVMFIDRMSTIRRRLFGKQLKEMVRSHKKSRGRETA
jgi:peptide deformylase